MNYIEFWYNNLPDWGKTIVMAIILVMSVLALAFLKQNKII